MQYFASAEDRYKIRRSKVIIVVDRTVKIYFLMKILINYI